jgi:cell wall-associated NlpC family hydrolase
MKKPYAIAGVLLLTITTCASPAAADTEPDHSPSRTNLSPQDLWSIASESKAKQTLLEKQQADAAAQIAAETIYRQQLEHNTARVNGMIRSLEKHVGKTWYVFSGSTPSGWDCSGLTLWAYEHIGIELPHRASVQSTMGEEVTEPKVGDIVAFTYNKSKSAYHVGVYVGDGNMIHVARDGHRTSVDNIARFAGSYSKVTYHRFIETN